MAQAATVNKNDAKRLSGGKADDLIDHLVDDLCVALDNKGRDHDTVGHHRNNVACSASMQCGVVCQVLSKISKTQV